MRSQKLWNACANITATNIPNRHVVRCRCTVNVKIWLPVLVATRRAVTYMGFATESLDIERTEGNKMIHVHRARSVWRHMKAMRRKLWAGTQDLAHGHVVPKAGAYSTPFVRMYRLENLASIKKRCWCHSGVCWIVLHALACALVSL